MHTPAEFPNDLASCHARIAELGLLVENLQHQLKQLLRARYGRRSEKLDDPGQLKLFQGILEKVWEQPPAEGEAEEGEEDAPEPGPRRRGRRPLPADLPVQRVEHARIKYACRKCQANVQAADKPMQPIEKGLPGPGLLAQVVTAKYCDHVPLYRQEAIFARSGVDIPRETMWGWIRALAAEVAPLC